MDGAAAVVAGVVLGLPGGGLALSEADIPALVILGLRGVLAPALVFLCLRELKLHIELVELVLEHGKNVALVLLVGLQRGLRLGDVGLLGGDLHLDGGAGHGSLGGYKKRGPPPVQFL